VRLAEQLGTTTDYLAAGKDCIVTEPVPAIKADKRLSLRSKRAVITLLEELYQK